TWSKISTRTLLLPPTAFAAGTSLAERGFVDASLVGGSLLAVAMSLLAFSLPPAHASGFPSGPTFFRPGRVCPRDPCAFGPVRGAWSRFLPRALRVAPATASRRA